MKIVFFGLAGTGTSSTGRELTKQLNLTFISSGDMMRQKAQEHNLSIYEFEELCIKDSSYDLELDQRVKNYGKKHDNFIFESRLAWYFIPDAIKIYFSCDSDLVYKRIAKRECLPLNEAIKLTKQREAVVMKRYSIIYPHIAFPPNKNEFDFILDTTDDTISESVEKIKSFLKKLNEKK